LVFWLAYDTPFSKSILFLLAVMLLEEYRAEVINFFKNPFWDFKERNHKHG
jgi:hypothetical protein